MNKKIFTIGLAGLCALSAFAADLEITADTAWGNITAGDTIYFVGNDLTLTRSGYQRDLNSITFNVGPYTGNKVLMAADSKYLQFNSGNVITGEGGSITFEAADDGENYAELRFSGNLSVDNANVTFKAGDRGVVVDTGTRTISLTNGAVVNVDFSGKSIEDGRRLLLQVQDKNAAINFVGDHSEFNNVAFSGINSSVNGYAVNFNNTGDSIKFRNTVYSDFGRAVVNANGKAVSFEAVGTVGTYTATNFTNYKSITFSGTGTQSFNSTAFKGGAGSTVLINSASAITQGTLNIQGNMVIDGATDFTLGADSDNPLVLAGGGVITVNKGAADSVVNLNTKGYFKIAANTTLILNRSLVNVYNVSMGLQNNSKLVLNEKSTLDTVFTLENGAKASLGVGADLTLKGFDFAAAGSVLTLDFANGAVLEVSELQNFTENNGAIKIVGDIVNRFKLAATDEQKSDWENRIFDANGNKVSWAKISDGLWYVNAGAVPEPATVAAIFGAVALGFAAWRRRR